MTSPTAKQITPAILDWLLEGDPAIRWQVHRDLIESDEDIVLAEQARVAEEGWGARLLALQDPQGTWAGGLYSPKWTSTTYTLLSLRRIGLPPKHPQALKGCQLLLEKGFLEQYGGINYGKSLTHPETCITGMVLSVLAYFQYEDERIERVAQHLIEQQLGDAGWNCRSYRGDTHSSFHTTASVLEGLLEYQKLHPGSRLPLTEAQAAGREFLLQHRLYKSHRTGNVVDPRMARLPFPPRWYYDVLKGLDYFHASKAPHDPRAQDAIDLLRSKRKKDGRWLLNSGPSGAIFFQFEKAGQPSRWNTLRALRVLKWWGSG